MAAHIFFGGLMIISYNIQLSTSIFCRILKGVNRASSTQSLEEITPRRNFLTTNLLKRELDDYDANTTFIIFICQTSGAVFFR